MEAKEILIKDYMKHIDHYAIRHDDIEITNIREKSDVIVVSFEYGEGYYKEEITIASLDLLVFVYNNKPIVN
jgi:hypothetical protein